MSAVACGRLHARSLADPTKAMALPRRSPFAVPALFVACALASCGSAPRLLPSFESAGLRIEVVTTKKLKPSRKKPGNYLELTVKIWNNHDDRISFEPDQVRLLYGQEREEVAPVDIDAKVLEVQCKQPKEFKWRFETPEPLEEGTYPVEIRKIMVGDSALGETARIEIVVP